MKYVNSTEQFKKNGGFQVELQKTIEAELNPECDFTTPDDDSVVTEEVVEPPATKNAQKEKIKLEHVAPTKDEKKYFVPDKIFVSRRTVHRWMHGCGAAYGLHVKGFTDRRNDPDIVQETSEYAQIMDELEKRMRLWMKDKNGKIVIADSQRAVNKQIENATDGAYDELKTYYELEKTPPPQCGALHDPEKCKCKNTIVHWGHDEAVFWANSLSKMEWTINGERRLRPKNPGKGVMVSAFVSEEADRGFGIHVSQEEWDKVEPIYNKVKEQHPWFNLPDQLPNGNKQIGVALFFHGKAHALEGAEDDPTKTGWWNCEKFKIQCQFLIECFNKLYDTSKYQLLVQVDRSSGHMSKGVDTLNTSSLNMTDGGLCKGKLRPAIRDTTVAREDLGPHYPKGENAKAEARRLGMIDPETLRQYGKYPDENDTTRYDNIGPKYGNDAVLVEVPDNVDATHEAKKVSVKLIKSSHSYIFEYTVPVGTKPKAEILVSDWWYGMRKGKMQLLWETGWINPADKDEHGQPTPDGRTQWLNDWGAKYTPTEEQLEKAQKPTKRGMKHIATARLNKRKDFQEERTVIEKLFNEHGHLVVASPRYHPDMAGLGIEYCWGKAKWCFRRLVLFFFFFFFFFFAFTVIQ